MLASEKRKQERYEKRQLQRQLKRIEINEEFGTFEEIFSYDHLLQSFYKCRKGIRWKASTIEYERNIIMNIAELHEQLMNGTWESKGFYKFTISERGKTREISSVHISERIVQKCLCDYYLVPLLSRYLIYDNGASQKGKGTSFALARMKKHLQDHHIKYGNEGYILLYDFSNYFGNINHDVLIEIIDRYVLNQRAKSLLLYLVDQCGDIGLTLGSQVNQILAIIFANKLDHMFKDQSSVHGCARYMDDGYAITRTYSEAEYYRDMLYAVAESLGIHINEKKVRICKLSNGFVFLKKKVRLKVNGYVSIVPVRKTTKRFRIKLKKFKKLNIPYSEVIKTFKTWMGSFKLYDTYKTTCSMNEYFNELFIYDFMKGMVTQYG